VDGIARRPLWAGSPATVAASATIAGICTLPQPRVAPRAQLPALGWSAPTCSLCPSVRSEGRLAGARSRMLDPTLPTMTEVLRTVANNQTLSVGLPAGEPMLPARRPWWTQAWRPTR